MKWFSFPFIIKKTRPLPIPVVSKMLISALCTPCWNSLPCSNVRQISAKTQSRSMRISIDAIFPHIKVGGAVTRMASVNIISGTIFQCFIALVGVVLNTSSTIDCETRRPQIQTATKLIPITDPRWHGEVAPIDTRFNR